VKIYIVTSGVYSDYGIEAVFTEWEYADQYVLELDKTTPYGGVEVEEWDADDPEKRNLVGVNVYMAAVPAGGERIVGKGKITKMVPKNARCNVIVDDNALYWRVWVESYVSREHAKKLAAEALQKLRREQP